MRWLPTAVAIAVGFVVLLDFFFKHPILEPLGVAFRDWTIILSAFALLLGVINLLIVHIKRIIRRDEPGVGYSAIVLVTSLVVSALGLWYGLPSDSMSWIFDNVYVPLQGAFFALLAFFILTAAYANASFCALA